MYGLGAFYRGLDQLRSCPCVSFYGNLAKDMFHFVWKWYVSRAVGNWASIVLSNSTCCWWIRIVDDFTYFLHEEMFNKICLQVPLVIWVYSRYNYHVSVHTLHVTQCKTKLLNSLRNKMNNMVLRLEDRAPERKYLVSIPVGDKIV